MKYVNDMSGSIGFFDSGLGGISVLKESIRLLPSENYIYLGDSVNAPYGTKTREDVQRISEKNLVYLMEMGAKAVVIACNTATSVAVEYLREKYKDFPIIGVEPAVKPAVTAHKGEKILVMATPMTLRETKFKNLIAKYAKDAAVVSVNCEGLMEFVEAGDYGSKELEEYLKSRLITDETSGAGAVVLGCTHYPFIKKSIVKVMKYDIPMYDGGVGTSMQLMRVLQAKGLLKLENRGADCRGEVIFKNSAKDAVFFEVAEKLLERNK